MNPTNYPEAKTNAAAMTWLAMLNNPDHLAKARAIMPATSHSGSAAAFTSTPASQHRQVQKIGTRPTGDFEQRADQPKAANQFQNRETTGPAKDRTSQYSNARRQSVSGATTGVKRSAAPRTWLEGDPFNWMGRRVRHLRTSAIYKIRQVFKSGRVEMEKAWMTYSSDVNSIRVNFEPCL
jgi:hypothetical protein